MVLATLKQSKCVFCASPFCYTCLHLKNPLAVFVFGDYKCKMFSDKDSCQLLICCRRRRQLSWNEGVQRLSELKCQSWSWNQIVNILSGLWTRCIHIWPDHTCMFSPSLSLPTPWISSLMTRIPLFPRRSGSGLSLFHQPSVGRTVLGFLVRTITFSGFN